jgi:soluble lytic murein transglycosylase
MKHIRSSHLIVGVAAACVIGLAWPATSRVGVERPRAVEFPTLWLAPAPANAVAGSRAIADAVEDLSNGQAAQALPVLARAAAASGPPLDNDALGGYARLYLGRAQIALNQINAARETADRLVAAQPSGYLAHAAQWLSADVAEAAEDWPRAVAALRVLAESDRVQPDRAHLRLGQAAAKAGDLGGARDALTKVYYEYPLSSHADAAAAELGRLGLPTAPTSVAEVGRGMARAQALFDAKRFTDARAAFAAVFNIAAGEDRSLIELRLAECDYHLKRYAAARDKLRALIPQHVEAEFFYFTTLRAMGAHGEYVERARAFVEGHPSHLLSQETLNNLASHFILTGDDAKAAEVFAESYRRFPVGIYVDRAAWKAGWWKYRSGAYADAIAIFESAAATHARSDSRPSWLYWAARARQRLGERAQAIDGFRRVIADYRHSYYGRQAARALTALAPTAPVPPPISDAAGATLASIAPGVPPPNAPAIRALLAAGLHDAARLELRLAEIEHGRTPLLDATTAYTMNKQGELRAAIIRMRAAYPQFRADGGEQLPAEIRRIIYPIGYWDVIARHAAAFKLDPYLMAALIAQESTFQPEVKSSAGAWGLMQIMPATGRLIANRLKIRPYSTARLKQPEVNVRIGMANFAGLLTKYDGNVVPVLAGYNAGDTRATRWLAQKPDLELDEFIDDIPYPETQNYVKRILGSVDDYRMLYANAPAATAVAPATKPVPAKKAAPAKKQ